MNDTRFETLKGLIEEQNRNMQAEGRKRSIISVVLVLFVTGYMIFLTSTISRIITPDTVAEMTLDYMLEHAPEFRSRIITAAADALPKALDQGVKQLYSLIPAFRLSLEEQIKDSSMKIQEEFSQAMTAAVGGMVQARKDDIVDTFLNPAANMAERKERLEQFAKDLEVGLETSFGDQSQVDISGLKKELDHLALTPEAGLTETQVQVKKIMIYFLYLTDFPI